MCCGCSQKNLYEFQSSSAWGTAIPIIVLVYFWSFFLWSADKFMNLTDRSEHINY